MDTKLKNSHKRGIIITVILLAFCAVMMLSQYDSIRGDGRDGADCVRGVLFRYTLGEQYRDRIWRKGIIWCIISTPMTRILRRC